MFVEKNVKPGNIKEVRTLFNERDVDNIVDRILEASNDPKKIEEALGKSRKVAAAADRVINEGGPMSF